MGDVLDAAAVRRWCRVAAEALGRARADIDAINVFPVADGDTGTNMHLTVLAVAEAVDGLPDDSDPAAVWHAVSQAALFGARGNSGVILSQVLRGLADVLIRGGELGEALRHASELAYGAVAHPVEGTMLSVLRAAGEACPPGAGTTAIRTVAESARTALGETTGQLEELARNGVVDAGAAGLCVMLDTLAAVITGEYLTAYGVPHRTAAVRPAGAAAAHGGSAAGDDGPEGFGYEVMYLLEAADESVPPLRRDLDALGDSLVVAGGDGLWNVHVHVDDAGAAIEAGLRVGRPYRIRVTYLQERHARHTGRGVVAITDGDGLATLFEAHGAVAVRGGPGRLPALAELVEAIVLAGDEVTVVPTGDEALPLAEGAAQRARDEGLRVSVIPALAPPQALAALAVHDPLRRFDDDAIAMTHAAGATRFGEVRVAEEEAVTSAGRCRPGDVLGLVEGAVCLLGPDLDGVTVQVVDRMLAGGGELITLITGPARRPADVAREHLRTVRPDVEVDVYEAPAPGRPGLLIGVA